MCYIPKVFIQAPKLELLITCVAFPPYTSTHETGFKSSSGVSVVSPTLCLNPTVHKDRSLIKLGKPLLLLISW